MGPRNKQNPTESSSYWYVRGGQINLQKGHASAAAFQAHLTPNLRTGESGAGVSLTIILTVLFCLVLEAASLQGENCRLWKLSKVHLRQQKWGSKGAHLCLSVSPHMAHDGVL